MRQKKSRLISLAILLSVAGLTNVTFAQTSVSSRQLPVTCFAK